MLQNKLHVFAARFTLASIWFDQEPGFDLTKCAFVVSLLVFKRDNLPKSLARTAKECNKVTFGWCSSIVNSLGDKRLSAVSEQTRSKTARIFFFFLDLGPFYARPKPKISFLIVPPLDFSLSRKKAPLACCLCVLFAPLEVFFIWVGRVTCRPWSLQQQHRAGRRWLRARNVDWSFMRSYDRRSKHSSGSVQEHQRGKENTKDLRIRSLHRRRSFGSSRSLAWASGLPKGLGERRF